MAGGDGARQVYPGVRCLVTSSLPADNPDEDDDAERPAFA
jgi:hypothetical protein